VLGELVPASVRAVEVFGDPEDVPLYPEEEAAVARAVTGRRREFATVRHCARQALAHLGGPVGPIVPGPRGAPQWPDGFVGSMTHCTGYRAAAVARRADVATLGVDAEPHAPLPDNVLRLIAGPAECAQLAELASGAPDTHWDRVLFCAKEALYKAWFPVTGRWLGFEEAKVTLDPGSASFSARVLVPGAVIGDQTRTRFRGRFAVRDGLILTTLVWTLRHAG
jgi:4'-phosphopantetheinyl transferase EntD